jgi:hypothetical protein
MDSPIVGRLDAGHWPTDNDRARGWRRFRPRKRMIAALMAAILTFGIVFGFAAALNLTTDSLGAATTTVAACQAGALNATYTSTYSAAAPGYTVGTVTVTGLAATCYSKAYKVTLSGAANASLGEATGTTPAAGTSFAATFAPAVSAAAVTGISVVISG